MKKKTCPNARHRLCSRLQYLLCLKKPMLACLHMHAKNFCSRCICKIQRRVSHTKTCVHDAMSYCGTLEYLSQTHSSFGGHSTKLLCNMFTPLLGIHCKNCFNWEQFTMYLPVLFGHNINNVDWCIFTLMSTNAFLSSPDAVIVVFFRFHYFFKSKMTVLDPQTMTVLKAVVSCSTNAVFRS